MNLEKSTRYLGKITENEIIWKWYLIIKEWEASILTQKAFCKKNNLDYRQFSSKTYRIIYRKENDPDFYYKYLPIVQEYIEGKRSQSEIIKNYDISYSELSAFGTHVRYLKVIEKMKEKMEKKELNFIEIPALQPSTAIVEERQFDPDLKPKQELLKKQNDVELIISNAVRVIISPELGTEKLIKMIEFLKDL